MRQKSMQVSNRAVARIDAFSTEYHEMGRHLKNMGRAIQGKPAETDAKENGKVARVFKGAFKVEGALISSINRNAGGHYPCPVNRLRRRPLFWKQCGNRQQNGTGKTPAPSHDKESR